MANLKVRYLVARQRKAGPYYYWVPNKDLKRAGFPIHPLGTDLPEAIRKAEAFNAKIDHYRIFGHRPPSRRPGTFAALDDLFQKDHSFRHLAVRTQRDYAYSIRTAIEWAGDIPVRGITRKAVKAWLRSVMEEKGEARARNIAAAFRRAMSFGVDEGWLAVNPATQLRMPQGKTRARVWTEAERDVFCAKAEALGRPSMSLAVLLGWCLGQRPADLRTLAWDAYDGRTVVLKQGKTGKTVAIPCLPELKRRLDTTPRTGRLIVLNEVTGEPYQESAFQHLFAEIRAKAALPDDLQFRDLRRTLATALGAAGCTDDQIRAVTGHQTRNVVAVYVRPDETFAKGAMDKLEASRRALAEAKVERVN